MWPVLFCTPLLLLVLAPASLAEDPLPCGGGNCTNNAECGGQPAGECDLVNKTCVCDCRTRGNPRCDYERKKRYNAFFLALGLTIFGAARWYLGYTAIATGQAAIGFTLLLAMTIMKCTFKSEKKAEKKKKKKEQRLLDDIHKTNPEIHIQVDMDEYDSKLKVYSMCFCCCGCLFFLCLLTMAVWWFVDWIWILAGMPDADGYDLVPF